nr:zinc finger protein 862-like [Misgurnus anguillicaudatus]
MMQNVELFVLLLQKADLLDWREQIVGFGSDGAAVMVGKHGGVATLMRQDVPHLINHCLGHGIELAALDTINAHEKMKRVMDMLKGLYKQYHYSPKAWRELKEVGDMLNQKVWKPTNLGGTRSASADMIGRAKQCLYLLKDYEQLSFIVLVQDILKTLSRYVIIYNLFVKIVL